MATKARRPGAGDGQRRQRPVGRRRRPHGRRLSVAAPTRRSLECPCASPCGRPDLQRGREPRELSSGVRAAVPDVGVLVVDDDSPDGTAARSPPATSSATSRCSSGGQARPRLGLPRRVPPGHRRWRRRLRADRRRPVPRPGRRCRRCSPTSSTAPTWRSAAATCPAGRTENWSWRRRWLSRWGNRYAAGVLGLAVNDATAGYRAYRADALEAMDFETVTAEGYGFQIEMTHRLVRAGGRIVEFPIEFRDRRPASRSCRRASSARRRARRPPVARRPPRPPHRRRRG